MAGAGGVEIEQTVSGSAATLLFTLLDEVKVVTTFASPTQASLSRNLDTDERRRRSSITRVPY